MSMAERNRHLTRKGESKAHSLAHKYDGHKMVTVINHNYFERHYRPRFAASVRSHGVA